MGDATKKRLEDNPKDALEAYIRYLWSGYYKWYEAAVATNQRIWLATQTLTIVAGFGSAVMAAVSAEPWFRGTLTLRVAMIVLPLVGTLAASIAASSKVMGRWQVREQGRKAIQKLVDSGRQRFAAATTPAEYSEIHVSLAKAVDAVEATQAEGYFPLLDMKSTTAEGLKANL